MTFWAEAYAARQREFEAGRLIASSELIRRRGLTQTEFDARLSDGELFFVDCGNGTEYYPAFLAGPCQGGSRCVFFRFCRSKERGQANAICEG